MTKENGETLGNTKATKTPCRCGCNLPTVRPDAMFLQGHDQRLVSILAHELIDSNLSEWNLELLKLSNWDERVDIQLRIDKVVAAVARVFSTGLAVKTDSAAMRLWELENKRTEAAARKAERKANKSAAKTKADAPKTLRVKIGRWTYEAEVHGMSQSGKVTAVRYTDKQGNEKTTDKFTLV